MRRCLALLVLGGCTYDPIEAPPAAPDGAIPGCTSFSEQLDTCALPEGMPLALSGDLTFDTNTGALFAGATPIAVDTMTLVTPAGEVKAILASTVTFAQGTHLRADGARPFAIVASDAIELGRDSLIDVSAGGAGARATCTNGAIVGEGRDGGGGGGGGGGFGGAGGTGGVGDDDSATASTGGAGGLAITLPPGTLGGCAGARGGDDNNDVAGEGGTGGGAVYLVAKRRIDLLANAAVDAGGGGGGGGAQHDLFFGDAGGGGGGSGGMIILEAPVVASSGTLAANGGGGGEGSGGQQGGRAGTAGDLTTARAAGGTGGSGSGSDGGGGGALPGLDGLAVDVPANGGGGGGGGGAGFIRIVSTAPDLNAAISPPPS